MQTFTDSKIIVNGKAILRLLEYIQYDDNWKARLESLGVQIDWGYGSPDLLEIVLDLLGFPEDGTDEDGFCRDWLRLGGEYDRNSDPSDFLNWLLEQKKSLHLEN